MDGVGESSQFEGLADGADGVLYGAGFDLLASADVAFPNPFDECLKDGNLFFAMKVLKVRAEMGREKLLPVLPITVPLLVVCSHHAIGDVVVCRAEKSFPEVLVFGRNRCHDAPCGDGNRDAKWVRNFVSSGKGAWDRDARSAMRFVAPAMWKAASGEDWHANIRSARARIKCAAVFAFDARRREVRATVGVLSQPEATWACSRLATFSRTSQCMSSPAISRSEFVMDPEGFFCDTSCVCMAWGKRMRHTIGRRFWFAPNHTPPAPNLDASQ